MGRGGKRVFRATADKQDYSQQSNVGSTVAIDIPLPAEQDGCVPQIYHYLWCKDPATAASCPGVIIPDTVVYKYRQVARRSQPPSKSCLSL